MIAGPAEVRERLLRMHADTGLGHVGGNLSCLDIVDVLHRDVMNDDDRFVLSKGHAAGALYAVLWGLGRISDQELGTWCADATLLPGHPVPSVPGVLFGTGSLGHGLSLSVGLALGLGWSESAGRIFCLTSDGEWQEGSTWEAFMLAAHRMPGNLTVIVDNNGLQGFGTTAATLSMADLPEKLAAFGAPVVRVDGHDRAALAAALQATAGFSVICAETVKGRGTSLAGLMESHYLPLPPQDRPRDARGAMGAP